MDIIKIRKHSVNAASSIEDMTLERLQIFEDLFNSMVDLGYTSMIPSLSFSRVDTFHIKVKSNLLQDIYVFWLLHDIQKNLDMIGIMYRLELFVLHLINRYDAIFIDDRLYIPLPQHGYPEFKIYTKCTNFVLNIEKYQLIYKNHCLINSTEKKDFLEKLNQYK